MGKIIDDVKFVETNDGFRIEIKGDKEAMRKMWDECGMGFLFGSASQSYFDPGFWKIFKDWCGPWLGAEE